MEIGLIVPGHQSGFFKEIPCVIKEVVEFQPTVLGGEFET
jgi:hypothetical protein